MFVATRRWRPRNRAPWAWVALASLVLAVLATFAYSHLARAWSCRYEDRRVIVGDEYTEQARLHRQRNPGASCERLIQDFAGHLDDVWVDDGMRRRHSALAGLYVTAIALFTVCLVAVVEAVARAERLGRVGRGIRRR